MRFYSQEAMLTLLPADAQCVTAALVRYSILAERHGGSIERLANLTKSERLKTAQINYEGKAKAVIWFRIEESAFIVDTLVSIGDKANIAEQFEVIWNGVAMIARSFGCTTIDGATKREALGRVYLSHGFEATGVNFRKSL